MGKPRLRPEKKQAATSHVKHLLTTTQLTQTEIAAKLREKHEYGNLSFVSTVNREHDCRPRPKSKKKRINPEEVLARKRERKMISPKKAYFRYVKDANQERQLFRNLKIRKEKISLFSRVYTDLLNTLDSNSIIAKRYQREGHIISGEVVRKIDATLGLRDEEFKNAVLTKAINEKSDVVARRNKGKQTNLDYANSIRLDPARYGFVRIPEEEYASLVNKPPSEFRKKLPAFLNKLEDRHTRTIIRREFPELLQSTLFKRERPRREAVVLEVIKDLQKRGIEINVSNIWRYQELVRKQAEKNKPKPKKKVVKKKTIAERKPDKSATPKPKRPRIVKQAENPQTTLARRLLVRGISPQQTQQKLHASFRKLTATQSHRIVDLIYKELRKKKKIPKF